MNILLILELNSSNFSQSYYSGLNESGSESTDSLLDEATEYLKVAKVKLVTVKDWNQIEDIKCQKKKLKKKIKHSPQSFMFCKFWLFLYLLICMIKIF